MDCVRTAVRQGAASVRCVYRRDRENMPGSRKEVGHAMDEGVEFEFNTLPVSLVHEAGPLTGLNVVRTELLVDENGGRARPRIVEGSEEIMPASAVIFAFGFRPSPPDWLADLGVDTLTDGRIETGVPAPGQTSNPGIFAAGDNVRGADLVVTAIADARASAESILTYLAARAERRKSA
jgi:glutamate synthase (NADPH/NADH) small chain